MIDSPFIDNWNWYWQHFHIGNIPSGRLTELLQALAVERITTNKVFFQHLRGPAAELHASRRMDSIADGDDYIEVVAINILNARLAWDCTMRSDHCKICNSHFGVNLAIGDSVLYMTKNDRLVLFKQPNSISVPFLLQHHRRTHRREREGCDENRFGTD